MVSQLYNVAMTVLRYAPTLRPGLFLDFQTITPLPDLLVAGKAIEFQWSSRAIYDRGEAAFQLSDMHCLRD
jgi:hypothetical protein